MAGERIAVRQSIKDEIELIFTGTITTSRRFDVTQLKKDMVSIFIEEGEFEYSGISQDSMASLVVSYHSKNMLSDDELDLAFEPIDLAISAYQSNTIGEALTYVIPVGFSYSNDEERELTSISYSYKIKY